MSAERGPLAALPLVCERAGIPYGYTLTIWSAGALCIRRFGLPGLAEVFLFAFGGTAGYAALALLARRKRRDGQPKPAAHDLAPDPLWENAVVLPALALTAAIAQLVPGAWLNFLVVPFVATAAYLGGLAVLVSLRAPPRGARPDTPPDELALTAGRPHRWPPAGGGQNQKPRRGRPPASLPATPGA